MADATSGISAKDNASSATGMFTGAAGGAEMDKESFMLLLVTQFQHQDPLNPMEDKEFIAQLAQFSALEQQMNTNKTMQELVKVQQAQQVISAASYIGREVSARGYGVNLTTVEKDGEKIREATVLQYSTDSSIARGSLTVLDQSGVQVASVDIGARAPGVHDFKWDGKLSNGSYAAPGVYTIRPTAYDAAGNLIALDTNVTGVVKGVTQYQGEQVLTLSDGRIVSLSNVREVMDSTVSKGDGDTTTKPEEKPKPDDTIKPEEKPKPDDTTKPDTTKPDTTTPDTTTPDTTKPDTTTPDTTTPDTTTPDTTTPDTTTPDETPSGSGTESGSTADDAAAAQSAAEAQAQSARSNVQAAARRVRSSTEDMLRNAMAM